jgi:hypothetical protein
MAPELADVVVAAEEEPVEVPDPWLVMMVVGFAVEEAFWIEEVALKLLLELELDDEMVP